MEPRIEIRTVEVPIPIKCQTPEPEIPLFNVSTLKPEDDIFTKVKSLLADIELHKAYETELASALKSCK